MRKSSALKPSKVRSYRSLTRVAVELKLVLLVGEPSWVAEGAQALWRNFFGPPFVQMFGDRLASLPGEFKQDLGNGIVLVQPYELPTQAGTPEAAERERELIAHLGPECFYDHERQLKPTRVPDLTSLQPF